MKIICVGRNYAAHIQELKNKQESEPALFLKPDTALLGKDQPFVIPTFSQEIHHEIELVVKINKVGKFIAPKFAQKYYNQISVGIDFTARDVQQTLKEKGLPWEKAKAFDGSAVVGRFIDIAEIKEIDNLSFSLQKNGEEVQLGNSQQMLMNINELIAYISQYFTLKTGDLIFTGTPSGVGKIQSGDELVGFLESEPLLNVKVL